MSRFSSLSPDAQSQILGLLINLGMKAVEKYSQEKYQTPAGLTEAEILARVEAILIRPAADLVAEGEAGIGPTP